MNLSEKIRSCIAVLALILLLTATFFYGCQPFEPVKIAVVTLEPVDSTTYTTCFAEGKIIDQGDEDIIQVGFCWSETSGPELSDNYKPAATPGSDGIFSAEITGLQAGSDYYIRAYLQQVDTVIYSDEQEQFTTEQYQKPTVEIDSIQKKWYERAVVWGSVTDDGGRPVLKKGICWSRQADPDILLDSVSYNGGGSESFDSEMKGLTADTKYYVRAFAINAADTAYSTKDSIFTTQDSTGTGTVTDINGNQYNTVKMGNQWWMAENIKATKYPDNSNITSAQNTDEWINLTISSRAYCYYDKSSTNRDTYGALYTWAGAMKGAYSSAANPSGVKGICPDGWHIPSDEEWKELEMYLGMSLVDADREGDRGTDEGGQLKETGTVHWAINTGATNSTLFTALPGGWRQNGTGQFGTLGYYSYYWTSTQNSSNDAWIRQLYGNLTKIGRSSEPKQAGYSVRCVKDLE